MKAVLRFDLNDPQEAEEFRRHCKANDMASVLYGLCNDKGIPAKTRAIVNSLCDSNGIDFNEIYT